MRDFKTTVFYNGEDYLVEGELSYYNDVIEDWNYQGSLVGTHDNIVVDEVKIHKIENLDEPNKKILDSDIEDIKYVISEKYNG